MTRIVIASAASFETDETISRLQKNRIEFTRIVAGIGMSEAAMIAAKTRELISDRDVIFCCTAGVVGKFDHIRLFLATTVELGSWDVRNGRTDLLQGFDPPLNFSPKNFALPKCHALCSLGVSTSADELRANASKHDALAVVETMELYAVARAWLPLARSFTAVVATTNATGEGARSEWRANFKEAASITAAFLDDAVAQLK